MQAKKLPLDNARYAASLIVRQVLEEGAYTNIALNKFLRARRLGDLDRRFMTELVYTAVKASGTIDWYLRQCVSRPLEKIDGAVLSLLRISVCQLLFMDRVPDAAACSEAVSLARSISHEGSAKFVNGVLRGLLRKKKAGEFVFPDREQDEAGYLALAYSHPRWLVKKWLGQFGSEATERLCAFNNTAAPVCLRANTLAVSRDELLGRLAGAGAQARPSRWSCDGIVCGRLPGMEKIFAGMENAFYVQDESSMLVAGILDPQPGETVIDMCSAPGGKTTHLAQKMLNRGKILAGDVHEHKIKLIEENARRLGIDIIEAKLRDASVFDETLAGTADRVLVDAPCSGLGVLRRRAESRWRRKKSELKIFPPLQLAILSNAARYAKAKGRIVYSTCTIEAAENHYVVEEFLKQNPDWERREITHPISGEKISELQLLPQRDGTDGFYICALQRRSAQENGAL